MASSSANLRKALNLIREGKANQARPILTRLLRDEPNNAQGWFLLSYVVEETQQQEYALIQALKADAKFERALRRLAELRGQPMPKPLAEPSEIEEPEPTEPVVAPDEKPAPMFAEFEDDAQDTPAKPRRNWVRLIAFGLLVFVVAIAAYAGYQLYAPQLAVTFPTATMVATRALPPTWTPGVQVTATQAATPTRSVQFEPVDPATLAEMQAISQLVGNVRGLDFVSEPQVAFIDESALIQFVATQLLDETKAQELTADEIVLRAMGLLGENDYLTDYHLNRYLDPYGGYYDAENNRILLVGDSFEGVTQYAFARLAANAMLRQNQATVASRVGDCPVFSDACRALAVLVGGDWALAADQWLEVNGSEELKQAVQALGDPHQMIQVQAPTDFAQLDLDLPFTAGRDFVQAIFGQGDWAQVDDVYTLPPASVEQVLHLEKYSASEAPSAMDDPSLSSVLGSGWNSLANGNLGEWLTYILLAHGIDVDSRVVESAALAAAAGWNGDQLQAFLRQSDSAIVLAEHWVMDSEQDASQLQSALAQYLGARFEDGTSTLGGGECWAAAGVRACLFNSGAEVLWLQGPDEIVVLQVMLAQYPQFQ